ncbi:IDEAL domain-containing protein [Paenibacillus sp. CAU 1782]
MSIHVEDWVTGRTREGALIHGFVESLDEIRGIASVYVVKSDQEPLIGKKATVRSIWLRTLPDARLAGSALVPDLIDLALATDDEAWFLELSDGANSGKAAAAQPVGPEGWKAAPINRLGKLTQ